MPTAALSVSIDTRNVEHVLDAALKLSRDPAGPCKPLLRRLLNTVEHDATGKAPVATGALRRSARSEFIDSGAGATVARVSYGGLASKYASVQHEHTEFRHNLLPGQDRNYIDRGTLVGKISARDRMSSRINKKTGVISMSFTKAGTFTLRREGARRRKHPLLGYRGGQAHWLFGAGDSAWNPRTAALWTHLLDEELRHVYNHELSVHT